MLKSLDLSFHVFQVLEEEYISLYGHLEHETKIRLGDREITSVLDWNFHQGHIRNWEEFKRELQNPTYNLPKKLEKCLIDAKLSDWRNEQQMRDALNEILGKRIYDWRECKHVKLRATTEKLFELYPHDDAIEVPSDELRRLNRFFMEDLFTEYLEKINEIRMAAIYERRHQKEPAALCLSGGGIRSGTFALGLLQGLARHKLLNQFDYLSTVSGGGYIGAWLTAWIHRHAGPNRGLPGVTSYLTNAQPDSKTDPDPPAIRHLRENSNFLTPEAGLMSADTWTFLAIYLRNLLLNWSVVIPLLLAVLLIPRFAVAVVLAQPLGVTFVGYAVLGVGFVSASWAIAYIAFSRPGLRTKLIEANPRWKERMGQRGFLKYCLVPLVIAAMTLTSYWAWTPTGKRSLYFLIFGLAASFVGLLWSGVVLRSWRRKRKVAIRRTWKESSVVAAFMLLIAGAVGGLITRAATVLTEGSNLLAANVDESWATELYVSYATPFFLLLFMLALTVFAGISSHFLGKITEEDREWWARFSAWALISAIAWAVFSTLVIFGPLALLAFPTILGGIGGLSGLLALVLGRSAKTPATSEKVSEGGLMAQLSSVFLPLLAVLFIAVFIAGLSLLTSKITKPVSLAVDELLTSAKPSPSPYVPRLITTVQDLDAPLPASAMTGGPPIPVQVGTTKIGEFSPTNIESNQSPNKHAIDHMRAVHYPRWWLVGGFMILLLGFGLLMARVINLNLFSLHNSYRSRLIRGFLAASRDKLLRQPNPFTGFDPADNVSMHELRPALLHEVDFKDFDDFVNQFKDAHEAVKKNTLSNPPTASQFLYSKLTEKVTSAIGDKDWDTPAPPGLRKDLIEDLNRILEDETIDLNRHEGFSKPSPQATDEQSTKGEAAPQALRFEYHIHRNRRTLELTYPQFIQASNYPPHRLLHVVNTTLNLVSGDNLAWQQRLAEPFTISPLHCGSYRVGYRRSKDYGGDDGISLGTAMAISGAAASSNMGYYTTSPVLSLVLTLFNVRLGWWLGNPGPAGSHPYRGLKTDERPDAASNKIYRRMSPTWSVLPVIYEAFGLTDDRSDYVYLTDGGHFENLAVYEMVLRRCTLIVVSDAAADPKYRFNDLANAVRKIRIDLGVPIEFPAVPIYEEAPSEAGKGGCYWAVGVIRYSQIDQRSDGSKAKDGILIYIKPAVYNTEPEDVVHYKRANPTFPNQTTADQFFDEPQFESYRALGSYIMDQMCGSHSGDLSKLQFVSQAIPNLVKLAPQMKEQYSTFWTDLTKT